MGSTALTESHDSEIVQAAIGAVFDRLSVVITRYGGFVERYMGDAVLAVFGVPVVHEDDPERAIRAALEMQGVLVEMRRAGETTLEMRIGMESGEVLVDPERVSESRDRMLTGDAVNTAARLQSAAGVGAVLVGPTTHSLTKDRIDFSAPKELALKGKSQPVAAYTALRIAAKHAGQRPALGFESPMVGRDEELAVLHQTLHRAQSEGRPALVTIFGPAGSGKSRLVRELLRHLDDMDQTFFWRAGRCLPYGGAAYSALAGAIETQCEVLADDPAEVVAHKVERSVQEFGGDTEMLIAIEHLLGLTTESAMGREQLFDTWRRFLERMAARYPLVLVLEDIHWADEGLLDFIEFLADWAKGAVLIVTLARPDLLDKRPTWGGGKRNYASIYLDPLGSDESEQMITGLLGDTLPEDVIALITGHAEGNPLYTEEVIRMLIDRDLLTGSPEEGWHLSASIKDIEVPRSIHALIAARLDGLATDEKTLLQDASVVGRVFWSGVAARLADQDDIQTKEQLGRLRIKELIIAREPSSLSDEHEYGFHHALIRDVAYDSLPKQVRAEKHSTVASWAESTRSGDREDVVEMIATHYEQALGYMSEIGAPEGEIHDAATKALYWATQAAERSRRMWQTIAALDWYRKAIAITETLSLTNEESARLWSQYAEAANHVLPHKDTARLYERALELYGDASSSEASLARARYGAVVSNMGDPVRAVDIAKEAVALLRVESDPDPLGKALGILGGLYWWLERPDDARVVLTEALGIARRVGDRHTECAASLSLAAVAYLERDWTEALSISRRSLKIARELGDLNLLSRATNHQRAFLEIYGDPDGVAIDLQEAVALARRHKNRGLHLHLTGMLTKEYSNLGQLDEADEALEQAWADMPPTDPHTKLLAMVRWAEIDLFRGDLTRAQDRLDEVNAIDETVQGDTELYLIKAYIQAEIDHLRGDDTAAMSRLTPLLDNMDALLRFALPQMLLRAIRIAVARGESERAMVWRGILDHKPTLIDEAFKPWCDAILTTDPVIAADLLAEAAGRLRALHLLILEALCLTDLARVEKGLGRDHTRTLVPVISFLRTSGALVYLEAAEALMRANER